MRLVTVFSAPFLGGSELFNLEFLRLAVERGTVIDAIVPDEGALADALQPIAEHIEVLPLPGSLAALSRFDRRVSGRAARALRSLHGYRRTLRDALEQRPGALCCLGFRAQLGVAATGLARHRPTCWVVHEVVPDGPFGRLWGRASRSCEAIYTYSQSAASQLALRGSPTEVCDVRFDLRPLGAVAPPGSPPARLGLVGDLFELKNHLGFLEVIRTVRAEGHDIRGIIVGRDTSAMNPTADYVQAVREGVESLGGAVQLVAAKPGDMPGRFAEMDLLLHLSSVPESFGRVCVEAMASGRPVVGFAHGAVAELVEDGRTGLLAPPGDLAQVTAEVLRLRTDSRRFDALAQSARERALERWSDSVPGRTIGDALADFARESIAPLSGSV